MLKSRLALAFLLLSILCIVGAGTVYADEGYQGWSPIKNTGYAVISNYQGMVVPPLTTVNVTAGTTNLTITKVVFIWRDPDDITRYQDEVPVKGPLTTPQIPPGPLDNLHPELIQWAKDNPNVEYLYAHSAYEPDKPGDWGVQALFIGEGGHRVGSVENVIKIRSTSFNVIPDLPVVGTAGALVTMLFGLGLFLHRKRQ
jgi:hypothetical protein